MRQKRVNKIIILSCILILLFSLLFLLQSNRNLRGIGLSETTNRIFHTEVAPNSTPPETSIKANTPTPILCNSTKTWRPSANFYTIEVPCGWTVFQADGGHSSSDSFSSDQKDSNFTIGWNTEENNIDLGGIPVNLGTKQAMKLIEGKYVHIYVNNIKGFNRNKTYSNTLHIHYYIDDPERVQIESILETIKFDLSEGDILNSNVIP